MKKALIAMSGGVDSSVAAYLTKKAGYDCIGVTMRLFGGDSAQENKCCSLDDVLDAKSVARRLGIPHHTFNFKSDFREKVIEPFIAAYENGATPNPCIECNRSLKFAALFDRARALGCDYIVTGHYARIAEHNGHTYLRTAADTHKDQTYFLWMLTEDNLRHTIFPLGDLTKDEVRRIAAAHGYDALVKKPESQEVCYIPDNDYRGFLEREGVHPEAGEYIDAEGKVVGRHQGCPFYTIGQRKGLGVALGYPAFVTHIDTATNRITLGTHDDLNTACVNARDIRIRDLQWLIDRPRVEARIRYRSAAAPASLAIDAANDTLELTFDNPVWAPTPGQSLVLYKDEMVVGGGIII